MKKTALLILVILLFNFSIVSAQTIETLDPENIGDNISWEDNVAYVLAGLANIYMDDHNFTYSPADKETFGMAYIGNYTDEDGGRMYTFQFDEKNLMLKEVVYIGTFHDNGKLTSLMNKIIGVYGLDEAPSFSKSSLENAYSVYSQYMDDFNMVASDKTICVYGYKSVSGQNDGMIFLDFINRAYYN